MNRREPPEPSEPLNRPNRESGSYEQVCDSTRTDCTWKRVPDDEEADDELGDEVELGLEALELPLPLSAGLPVIWTRCPTYLLRSTSPPLGTSVYFFPLSLLAVSLLLDGDVVEGVCVDGVEVDDVDEPVLELEPLSVSM